MKRIFLLAGLLVGSYTASAPVYVSATGGYAWGVPSTKIGEESINGKESVRFGTFGEGVNSQLRVGYFFNKTWGVDVSVGYLHGKDQVVKREVSEKNIAGTPLKATIDGEVIGRGRAFGAALSVTYNFTDNFYGRFGILTKIGGKTEAIAHSYTTTNQDIPVAALARLGLSLPGLSGLPTSAVIKQGATIETSYTEDYKGKMPFGTIAAFGYKYNVTEKLAIFAELEYMNISVKRDYSELKDFKQTFKANLNIGGVTRQVEVPLKTLEGFTNGSYNDVLRGQVYHERTNYVEEASKEELEKKIKNKNLPFAADNIQSIDDRAARAVCVFCFRHTKSPNHSIKNVRTCYKVRTPYNTSIP